MADPGVDEVEPREVVDGAGVERRVPRVRALEVGAEGEVGERGGVGVEDEAELGDVREAVVVFGAEGEFGEVGEGRDADGVEMPASTTTTTTSNQSISLASEWGGKGWEEWTYMSPSLSRFG